MFDASFSVSEFLDGAARALPWLAFAFLAWWVMFHAPLGRRVFRREISIRAPADKIWSASFLEPSPPGGWGGVLHIIEQKFKDGAPLRHETEFRGDARSGRTMNLVTRVTRLEPCARFESEHESIDGVMIAPANSVRYALRLEEIGDATLVALEISQPVRGVIGHLSTGRLHERHLDHLRAHCEGRPDWRPRRLIGRASAAWLAVAAVAASSALIGMRNPGLGGLCILLAISLELSVLVHEYGHFLAMRWFGHHDASIVLIPFFGGATFGMRSVSSRYEMAMIALAGPGISALAVLASTPLALWGIDAMQSGARDMKALVGLGVAITLSVAVPMNLFNLAPVGMFDGGQLVDALAHGRRTRWLIMSAIFVTLGLSMTSCESLSDFGVDVALIAAFWTYDLVTTKRLDRPLPPMRREQMATTLAALVLTFIIYADASRRLLPPIVAATREALPADAEENE